MFLTDSPQKCFYICRTCSQKLSVQKFRQSERQELSMLAFRPQVSPIPRLDCPWTRGFLSAIRFGATKSTCEAFAPIKVARFLRPSFAWLSNRAIILIRGRERCHSRLNKRGSVDDLRNIWPLIQVILRTLPSGTLRKTKRHRVRAVAQNVARLKYGLRKAAGERNGQVGGGTTSRSIRGKGNGKKYVEWRALHRGWIRNTILSRFG